MVDVSQSLPQQRENFKNSITAAMLKDIQAVMDNDDFDPLYFLENVVPTCKALMYVNWNETTKFLEESLNHPMNNGESFDGDGDATFRRKKRAPYVKDTKDEYCYPCCHGYCHETYCNGNCY